MSLTGFALNGYPINFLLQKKSTWIIGLMERGENATSVQDKRKRYKVIVKWNKIIEFR